jgi:phage terminase small subunit
VFCTYYLEGKCRGWANCKNPHLVKRKRTEPERVEENENELNWKERKHYLTNTNEGQRTEKNETKNAQLLPEITSGNPGVPAVKQEQRKMILNQDVAKAKGKRGREVILSRDVTND